MLSPDSVLEYVKLNLGFPYKSIEHEDQTILNYINTHTVNLFSGYVADIARMQFDADDAVPGTNNAEYIMNDPEGCDILNVKDVIHSITDAFVTNHPWLFFPSYDDLPGHYIDIFRSRTQNMLSLTKKTYEFVPPNKLYLTPIRFVTAFLVKYERTHPTDYSTIPAQWISVFLDLALADVKDLVASIRELYGELTTPWGPIPLNPEALRANAESIRTPALEKLASIPPSLILDVQ
jgi:hypothetical protein